MEAGLNIGNDCTDAVKICIYFFLIQLSGNYSGHEGEKKENSKDSVFQFQLFIL